MDSNKDRIIKNPLMQFIYLHGFASGPNSKKATVFKQAFNRKKISLTIPDLEEEGFENLTISGQIHIVESIISQNSGKCFGLIGSSLGGYLAALVAESNPSVVSIYLMAPAFKFLKRWKKKLDYKYGFSKLPEFINVFHYRYNEERRLNRHFFEDAEQWENVPFSRELPIRLVHGIHDESVDIQVSREFSGSRPWCEFLEIESDHGLLSHLDWLVDDCLKFYKKMGFL